MIFIYSNQTKQSTNTQTSRQYFDTNSKHITILSMKQTCYTPNQTTCAPLGRHYCSAECSRADLSIATKTNACTPCQPSRRAHRLLCVGPLTDTAHPLYQYKVEIGGDGCSQPLQSYYYTPLYAIISSYMISHIPYINRYISPYMPSFMALCMHHVYYCMDIGT